MSPAVPVHESRAVRALVLLHEEHLREFLQTWERARTMSLALPGTTDPAYASLEALGRHVLGAARHYLVWICESLTLPVPDVPATPGADTLADQAPAYMEHVLKGWRHALVAVHDDQLEASVYPSAWQTPYCIDAMLEHAVMHPIRHTFQLEELMRAHALANGRSMSDVTYRFDCEALSASELQALFAAAGLGGRVGDKIRRAFVKSPVVCLAYEGRRLVGVSRAITDGEYHAFVADVAVHPDVQRQGVGRRMMQELLARLPVWRVLLVADDDVSGFYAKHGFEPYPGVLARRDLDRLRDR